jgi:nitroimidazol reductase NimA-like FMN-containing flavoprotein (pyridoxamine 5'-phosphate oxidase superfamily)
VTDPRPDDPTPPEDTAEAAALERRAFVRRMGTDAVRTAGSVLGLSRILTRSAAAAGQTVISELERMQVGDPAAEAVIGAPADVTIVEAAEALPEVETPAPVASAPSAAPAPAAPAAAAPIAATLAVDDDQRAILEAARSAVVAVNRDGHPPQLTTAAIHWDGATARFLTLGWARRTTMLRADPAIGLLVDGPGDGRFVTIAGRARIVEGRDARDAALPLLRRDHGGDEAAVAAWDALLAEDADRAVVVIEPDQVLSGRR